MVTQLVKQYPAFIMVSEGVLPCSLNPATGPYPEPAESSSPHRSHLPKVRPNVIFLLRLGLPSGLLLPNLN